MTALDPFPSGSRSAIDDHLVGVLPLTARREPWMDEVLADHAALTALLEAHGSPVNLIDASLVSERADDLVAGARRHAVDARVFFARKANKALGVVDAVLSGGHGIDVASERELDQVLSRVPAGEVLERVIVTAAVKPLSLVTTAVRAGAVISIDNLDELDRVRTVAVTEGRAARIALRLRADLAGVEPSRFGLGTDTLRRLLADVDSWTSLTLDGLHFHLHGYSAAERAAALAEALDLTEHARALGHSPAFVDIGGGVPMRYLEDRSQWERFWSDLDSGRSLTWRDRPLGTVYPAWQAPVAAEWLDELLSTTVGDVPVGERLRDLGVRLHLEPGRALLDGAGLTVARVEHRKQQPDGTWLIGLSMNRTQCRSAADDFLLDPVLVPNPDARRTQSGEGFLVGAYCVEAELLTWRRLSFPHGVAVGDLVAFVNTAGYQMHILESASHQIPLARNLLRRDTDAWTLDAIDRRSEMP